MVAATGTLDQRVDLHGIFGVLRQKFLHLGIGQQLVLGKAKDLEGLVLRNEAALDAKTLFSHFLPARVLELLHVTLVLFFLQVLPDFF